MTLIYSPTLNELYRPFRVGSVQTLANPNLQAEQFTGGEAGVIAALKPGVRLEATYFTGYLSNLVSNITLSSTPSLITRLRQNLGRVRTRGVEANCQFTFDRYISCAASYQFVDATVTEFISDPTLVGLHTPLVPQNSFSFQATYARPDSMIVSVQGRAAGQEFDDDRNQFVLDPYLPLGSTFSRNVKQHLQVFEAGDNLLNSRYAIAKTPLEM